MHDLATVAPAFVEMAHRIVWATVATVGVDGRPRTRILHPLWEWDGTDLVGWSLMTAGQGELLTWRDWEGRHRSEFAPRN